MKEKRKSFTIQEVVAQLKHRTNKRNIEGMARFGINPRNTLGVSVVTLRHLAKDIGKNHKLAQQLWRSDIHEARILAAFIDDPKQVTAAQMDRWVKGFDSWDVCDQVCCNLFDQTDYAWGKAIEWSSRREEFVRRAAFALIAGLAWHRKDVPDTKFLPFLPCIIAASDDERNFVKKSVSWALRHIGKRSPTLGKKACAIARLLQSSSSASARWIGNDAIREFQAKGIKG